MSEMVLMLLRHVAHRCRDFQVHFHFYFLFLPNWSIRKRSWSAFFLLHFKKNKKATQGSILHFDPLSKEEIVPPLNSNTIDGSFIRTARNILLLFEYFWWLSHYYYYWRTSFSIKYHTCTHWIKTYFNIKQKMQHQ